MSVISIILKGLVTVKGKQILIIDDVADVRLRVRKTLESFGMIVFEAGSAVEGLDFIGRFAPKLLDLIILDLQMTGKSGFDFLSARKASASLSSVPVIVSSGLTDRVSVAKAIALGANDYIVKPINATLLLQRMRKHLMGDSFAAISLESRDALGLVLELPATIRKIEKTGFTLESPVRLAKNSRIDLPKAALDELELSDVVLVTRSEPVPMSFGGGYHALIEVVGIGNPVLAEKGNK